jgi:hypothetical protein
LHPTIEEQEAAATFRITSNDGPLMDPVNGCVRACTCAGARAVSMVNRRYGSSRMTAISVSSQRSFGAVAFAAVSNTGFDTSIESEDVMSMMTSR